MKLPKHRRDEAALNSRLIRRPIKRMVWLFLLPTFGAFCIGFLYPFFKGLFLSFCNFRITSQWTWTGLENYRKAFQDPGYMHAFWYTALFALVSLIVINLFAFTIAYALTQKFKGTNGGGNRGAGQAKAVIFFIVVAAISIIQLQASRRKEVQQ